MMSNPYKFGEIAAAYRYLAYLYPAGSVEHGVYKGVSNDIGHLLDMQKVEQAIRHAIALRMPDRKILQGYPPEYRQRCLDEIACYQQVLEDMQAGSVFLPARRVSFDSEPERS